MRFCILFMSLLPLGCIQTFHEKRVGEALWEIGYTDIALCNGTTAEDRCAKELTSTIEGRAEERCGENYHVEMQSCEKTQRVGIYAYVCQVKCKARSLSQDSQISGGGEYEQIAREIQLILGSVLVKEALESRPILSIKRGFGTDMAYLVRSDSEAGCARVLISTANRSLQVSGAEKVGCP